MPWTVWSDPDTLHGHEIADSAPLAALGIIARLAAQACRTSIAAVVMADATGHRCKAAHGLPAGLHDLPRGMGLCEHVLASGHFEIVDASRDPRFARDPMVVGGAAVRHFAGCALAQPGGRHVGMLFVADRASGRLSDAAHAALREFADLSMALLEAHAERARAAERVRRYEREIEAAARVLGTIRQRAFAADTGCYETVPAGLFGGDVVSTHALPDGSIVFLVGDVTGHDLGAALSTPLVLESFIRHAVAATDFGALLHAFNADLAAALPSGHFVAGVVGHLDAGRRHLRLWNGGLPRALYVNAAGEVRATFASTHLPLGIQSPLLFDATVVEHECEEPGHLAVCTDGVVEAMDASGAMFGTHRLAECLAAAAPAPRPATVLERLRAYTTRPLDDDATLYLVELGWPRNGG